MFSYELFYTIIDIVNQDQNTPILTASLTLDVFKHDGDE